MAAMLDKTPEVRTDAAFSQTLPTRVITYAWGDKYLDALMSLAMPALLAPGNLPYLASRLKQCELVILTEERSFHKVALHPVIDRVKEHCDVRLLELDDLVQVPDKYGTALTYALHRGFADLGPAMVDSWQIFLNADFILADDSLRHMLDHLVAGARIVAAPSYCVVQEDVEPILRRRVDRRSMALSMSNREMAALILRHRHNTIRGKTVNQRRVSMQLRDQFYWEVDADTLLGNQMPVAIVGLRPERHVAEPNSFWDYGLIREYCPQAPVTVLGDSDEFLMLELRGSDTLGEQLSLGWESPRTVASRLRSFLTTYQREFVKYPLTLHASELPAGVEQAREQLKAFVDEVFAHVPDALPAHANHPQWQYHHPTFLRGRHKRLSERFGMATALAPPPSRFSELDQAWWRMDAMEKSYAQRRKACAEASERARRLIEQALAPSNRKELDESFVEQLRQIADSSTEAGWGGMSAGTTLSRSCSGQAKVEGSAQLEVALSRILDRSQTELASAGSNLVSHLHLLVERYYERQLARLDAELEVRRRPLQDEYERLMPKAVSSAGIPQITHLTGRLPTTVDGPLHVRMAKGAYYKIFGEPPRVTRLSPYWSAFSHVVRIVDAATRAGASNVLVVGSGPQVVDGVVANMPGMQARARMSDVLNEHFGLAFERNPRFDICLCALELAELGQFPKLVRALTPYMRANGSILGFYYNPTLVPLPASDTGLVSMVTGLPEGAWVHYAGTRAIETVVRDFRRLSAPHLPRLLLVARIALGLVHIAPRALAANNAYAKAPAASLPTFPIACTSITVEVKVAERPEGPVPWRPAMPASDRA